MVTCNRCRCNRDAEYFTKFYRFCDECWEEVTVRNSDGTEVNPELIY